MNTKKELESEIRNFLIADGKTTTFNYDWVDLPNGKIGQLVDLSRQNYQKAEVSVITTNIQTNEKFLLKSVIGDTHNECLSQILEYLTTSKNQINSFTVHWSKIENGQMGSYNTSFFYCHDLLELAIKFFTGKNTKDYMIHDVKLNPLS